MRRDSTAAGETASLGNKTRGAAGKRVRLGAGGTLWEPTWCGVSA
jgi:hypothetical protein